MPYDCGNTLATKNRIVRILRIIRVIQITCAKSPKQKLLRIRFAGASDNLIKIGGIDVCLLNGCFSVFLDFCFLIYAEDFFNVVSVNIQLLTFRFKFLQLWSILYIFKGTEIIMVSVLFDIYGFCLNLFQNKKRIKNSSLNILPDKSFILPFWTVKEKLEQCLLQFILLQLANIINNLLLYLRQSFLFLFLILLDNTCLLHYVSL